MALVVIVSLGYLLVSRQWGRLREVPWLPALLIFFALALPWYALLVARLGFDAVLNFFLLENLGRFTHLDFGPSRGPTYYVGVFLADFAPWSLLVLASLPWGWRELRGAVTRSGSGTAETFQPRLFAACWILVWLAIFSFSKNKQEYYILPVYPVAACWLSAWIVDGRVHRLWRLLAGLPVLAAATVLILLGRGLLDFSWLLWGLLLFPLAFWAFSFRGRWAPATVTLSLFFSTAAYLFTEPLERFRPVEHFAGTIQGQSSSQSRVGLFSTRQSELDRLPESANRGDLYAGRGQSPLQPAG